MIPLVLSHETALSCWRAATEIDHAPSLSADETRHILDATVGSVHTRLLSSAAACEPLVKVAQPYDLLSSSRNDRRSTKRGRFHCMQTSPPDDSLVLWQTLGIGGEPVQLYLSTPEFCFVQMAGTLSETELAELGCELCGRFRLAPNERRGYVATSPLTTPQRLLAYAESATRVSGAKRARKVAHHVLANARTPQQAKLALMASLPRAMGGIGTPPPKLDHVIEVSDDIARVLGSRTRQPDLFWPETGTAVEYENRSWGDGDARADYEERKVDAYRRMGLDVISITRSQLHDLSTLRRIFEIIVRASGKRRRPVNERQAAKQAETHRELFG